MDYRKRQHHAAGISGMVLLKKIVPDQAAAFQ
jgi:hypothetical protein